jgi:quercetin dioxygenase-like cupin family protein
MQRRLVTRTSDSGQSIFVRPDTETDLMYASRHIPLHDEIGFHTTLTTDVVVVLEGEVVSVLDTRSRTLKARDVLVQRGTHHRWSNLTDKPAKLLAVLINDRGA